MKKSTMVELVQELEKISPRTSEIRVMIVEAQAGEYHDYKNKKYNCGKVEASSKLRKAGLIDLAKRVEAGEFDETADEADREMMRQDIINNSQSKSEANAMIKMFKLGEPVL